MSPDTLSLRDACARLGIGYSTATRWYAAGIREMAPGVRILEIGPRPSLRVSRYELDRFLGVRDEVSA